MKIHKHIATVQTISNSSNSSNNKYYYSSNSKKNAHKTVHFI